MHPWKFDPTKTQDPPARLISGGGFGQDILSFDARSSPSRRQRTTRTTRILATQGPKVPPSCFPLKSNQINRIGFAGRGSQMANGPRIIAAE
jgi:hypothetical protein